MANDGCRGAGMCYLKVVAVCICLAVLTGQLWGSDLIWAKSDYEIINTRIEAGGGCWVDDTHFVVVKGHQPAPGQEFEVEGLYYLDPSKPKEIRRIDLAPIELPIQRQIREASCQNESILFFVMAPDRKSSRLYKVKIGGQPELIADMRWASPSTISLEGQYVLGNKLTFDKGVREEHSDCNVRFLKPGLKALCWPRDTIAQWVTPQFVINEYLWRESILVRGAAGGKERIPNPESPLKLANGREIKQGYLLRDLENRIVQQLSTEQPPYQIYRSTFQLDPSGQYLYGACSRAEDHGTRQLTVGGRICRFLLDGSGQHWEEVVSVQQSPTDPFSLHDLHVNEQGDVVAVERGHRGVVSLWKYSGRTRAVEKIIQVPGAHDFGVPRVSPAGEWLSFLDQSLLFLVHVKGVTP